MSAVKSKYYIGDIHGRADLLEVMLAGIEADAAARKIAPQVVFLGDLTDRGPDSRGVMELVHHTLKKWGGSTLILGNHDEWFLNSLLYGEDYEYSESWVVHGGVQTVMSYCDGEFPLDFNIQIRDKYPHHLEMLQNASRMLVNGSFIGAHAGVNPMVSLWSQDNGDLNWIRERFFDFVDSKLAPVIHGHTFWGPQPIVTENRISIDTGAYNYGVLTTCLVDAENKTITLYQADRLNFGEVKPKLLNRGYGTIYDRLDEIFGDPNKVLGPITQENGVYG